MSLPISETAFISAVLRYVATDLRDRGVLPESAFATLWSRLAEVNYAVRERFILTELPQFGKALDAFLLLDQSTDRNTHQCVLENIYTQALPIFGMQFANDLTFGDPSFMDPQNVKALRDVSYLLYKYEAPYAKALVQETIDKFVIVDAELALRDLDLSADAALLERLFRGLDLADITPSHGPGAVADKSVAAGKFKWSSFPERLSNVYDYSYYAASPLHLCTKLREFMASSGDELFARLLTVPKDSRGPRVISCEPKELQWVQQGIRARLYDWIERHPLTRKHVRFTNQAVNGSLALEGSRDGSWATLDLSEASDRVSLAYVEKVFPEWVKPYLLASRSLGTILPNKQVVMLNKFAPMGSALCFPVLAITCWARLNTAGVMDSHVYGDDVIVRKRDVSRAIAALEAIGLKVNTSKSCYTGLFRESCGVDAYRGKNVTPVRIRTRWQNHQSPSVFESWISYSNSLFEHGYVRAANLIAARLGAIYGSIPQTVGDTLNVPHLRYLTEVVDQPPIRRNVRLQHLESRCTVVRVKSLPYKADGWTRLLQWFSKTNAKNTSSKPGGDQGVRGLPFRPYDTRRYTERQGAELSQKWVHLHPITSQPEWVPALGQSEVKIKPYTLKPWKGPIVDSVLKPEEVPCI